MIRFAAAILLSAFLLFQVQPILGRYIVPWFGGGAGVWTACMLFFQLMLLGGYAYAHLLAAKLQPRVQVGVHLVLIVVSAVSLPLQPDVDAAAVTGSSAPTVSILSLLLVQIGLPYLALSATAPLLQSWFARSFPGRSPYRLYALSNFGSMLALLSYPFVVEVVMPLRTQGWVWSAGYVGFAIAVGASGLKALGAPATAADATTAAGDDAGESTTSGGLWLLWVALAAVGSVLLLATTNHLCQDLASVPMLWVLPLAVYLSTFILCFEHDRWYDRRVFLPLLVVAAAVEVLLTEQLRATGTLVQIGVAMAVLFAGCMVCHGELVRTRPAVGRLTWFYLAVSVGGALGGLCVAVLAPLVFSDFWEYQISLTVAIGLALFSVLRAGRDRIDPARWRAAATAAAVLVVALAGAFAWKVRGDRTALVASERNFYGTLRVYKYIDPDGRRVIEMAVGHIKHGIQLADQPLWPTAYFGFDGGIGLAFRYLRESRAATGQRGLRVGIVGLGAGTLSAYSTAGDYVRYYEINPAVETMARRHFAFLANSEASGAAVSTQIGDARVLLQDELDSGAAQEFDLLVIDAFSGDAVPIHLLTREAFACYSQHLAEGGILAFNVVNNHVNLLPVLRSLTRQAGFEMRFVASAADPAATYPAKWVLVSKNRGFVEWPPLVLSAGLADPSDQREIEWTDDFASLWSVVAAGGAPGGRWDAVPFQGLFVVDYANRVMHDQEALARQGLRELWSATGGQCCAVIVTDGAMGTNAQQTADQLWRDSGLGRIPRAILCVWPANGPLAIRVGAGWSNREELAAKLASIPMVANGEMSPVVGLVQAIVAAARNRGG